MDALGVSSDGEDGVEVDAVLFGQRGGVRRRGEELVHVAEQGGTAADSLVRGLKLIASGCLTRPLSDQEWISCGNCAEGVCKVAVELVDEGLQY